MMCTSLVFQVNQKAPYIHHILQDYSLKDPWLHLHQIVQRSDDKVDQLQMQLKKQWQFIIISTLHSTLVTQTAQDV